MHNLFRVFLILTFVSVCAAAHAESDFAVGAGWFNFDRSHDASAGFSSEWRGNYVWYGLRPVAGAMINTDGGIYGYGGLNYDWEFAPHWFIAPGADIGLWRQGNSINLGGPVEFHESLELDYKFDNSTRVGAQVSHTSNADIYTTNPGANMLMVVFSFPL